MPGRGRPPLQVSGTGGMIWVRPAEFISNGIEPVAYSSRFRECWSFVHADVLVMVSNRPLAKT